MSDNNSSGADSIGGFIISIILQILFQYFISALIARIIGHPRASLIIFAVIFFGWMLLSTLNK